MTSRDDPQISAWNPRHESSLLGTMGGQGGAGVRVGGGVGGGGMGVGVMSEVIAPRVRWEGQGWRIGAGGSRDATPKRKKRGKVGEILLVLFLGGPILKSNIVEYIPD